MNVSDWMHRGRCVCVCVCDTDRRGSIEKDSKIIVLRLQGEHEHPLDAEEVYYKRICFNLQHYFMALMSINRFYRS